MNNVLQSFLKEHPGRDFDRDGLKIHYVDEGAGEPIVMLHGNPTWSFYYRHMIESLGQAYRVIVPDHIGCGLSDKPDDSHYTYTLASRVDDLEHLLDHLGLDRDLTLIMHDWGGMIGMTYAARHPERIARLVVSNTAAFHKPASKPCRRLSPFAAIVRWGAIMVRGLNAFCLGTAWIGCKRIKMTRELTAAYVAPYDSWKHRIAILRFVQDIPLDPADRAYELVSSVQDRLPMLRSVPMIILWGMKDFVFDRHFLDVWTRYFLTRRSIDFPMRGTTSLRMRPKRFARWCRPFSPRTLPSGSASVESSHFLYA